MPGWAQFCLFVYAACFVEGLGSHIRDLVLYGFHAYDWAVWPWRVMWYSFLLIEPVAVWLALRARWAAAPLGIAIMAGDLPPNWYYNWSAIKADPGLFWAPVGLLPMSSFGLFVVITGVPLWRLLRQRAHGAGTPEPS